MPTVEEMELVVSSLWRDDNGMRNESVDSCTTGNIDEMLFHGTNGKRSPINYCADNHCTEGRPVSNISDAGDVT